MEELTKKERELEKWKAQLKLLKKENRDLLREANDERNVAERAIKEGQARYNRTVEGKIDQIEAFLKELLNDLMEQVPAISKMKYRGIVDYGGTIFKEEG